MDSLQTLLLLMLLLIMTAIIYLFLLLTADLPIYDLFKNCIVTIIIIREAILT